MNELETLIDALTELPVGWNGYSSGPVYKQTADIAKRIAEACPQTWQCVPGDSGDMQLECHTAEYDIEIHICYTINKC